jgi:hypothetical protein
MKSFKQFISEENTNELDRLQLVDTLNQINEDCQQYLRKMAVDGKFHALYVSLQSEKWPTHEIQVRKNKAPVPTPKKILDSFDRVMGEMYGREFRSDSFIATGSPSVAAKSGVKHMIFPIGKFDYLWSPKIRDLIHGMGHEEDITNGEGLYFDIHDAEDEKAEDKVVKEFLEKKEFVFNKDIKQAANKGHDVMLDCKYYYAVPTSKILEHFDTFKKKIGNIHFDQSMKADLT